MYIEIDGDPKARNLQRITLKFVNKPLHWKQNIQKGNRWSGQSFSKFCSKEIIKLLISSLIKMNVSNT